MNEVSDARRSLLHQIILLAADPDTTGRHGRGNHEATGLGRERRSEGVMREWEREREA